jgi:hypothetical protein
LDLALHPIAQDVPGKPFATLTLAVGVLDAFQWSASHREGRFFREVAINRQPGPMREGCAEYGTFPSSNASNIVVVD